MSGSSKAPSPWSEQGSGRYMFKALDQVESLSDLLFWPLVRTPTHDIR